MAEGTFRRRYQICSSSRLARRPDLLERLRQEGQVEVVECLDRCTSCHFVQHALVCGQIVSANGPDELCRRLLEGEGERG